MSQVSVSRIARCVRTAPDLLSVAEMNEKMNGLHARMDQIQAEIGGLREPMAKLEGLLEGLREAITGRKVA